MAAKSKDVDWELIRIDYESGIKTLRLIASEHGISHTLINRKAKELDWNRDLSKRINDRAAAIVTKAEVSKIVTKEALVTERQIIDVNANIQATITLSHRSRIQKHQGLGELLYKELEAQTAGIEAFENLAELMKSDEGTDKLNELYKKVISTPSRIDSFKKLNESLKTLVGLERQVYGIADNANGDANTQKTEKFNGNSDAAADSYKKMIGI